MSAIPADERNEHVATIRATFGAVTDIEELADGYVFLLPGSMREQVAQFIERERLCCPFFRFDVEAGPLRLRLTGPQGVKPFIRAEVGEALGDEVARRAGFR